MEESILKSVKKILGIYPDDDSFDLDVITHINSAFSVLHQLGVGPSDGFYIEDEEAVWDDFGAELETPVIREVQTVVYLRVRLLLTRPRPHTRSPRSSGRSWSTSGESTCNAKTPHGWTRIRRSWR